MDPISCTIGNIINYLSSLFEKGLEYSTINGHRSAISAFHPNIEGKPIGQHPQVTALMKGISREKPQTPKYTHIWDIDTVLNYFRSSPENEHLDLKTLSLKTITLLGLVAPKRGSELALLDTNFMGKTETAFKFQVVDPTKNFKQGKKNEPIEFYKFVQNTKLCPHHALCTYIRMTSEFRVQQHKTSKFVCKLCSPS